MTVAPSYHPRSALSEFSHSLRIALVFNELTFNCQKISKSGISQTKSLSGTGGLPYQSLRKAEQKLLLAGWLLRERAKSVLTLATKTQGGGPLK